MASEPKPAGLNGQDSFAHCRRLGQPQLHLHLAPVSLDLSRCPVLGPRDASDEGDLILTGWVRETTTWCGCWPRRHTQRQLAECAGLRADIKERSSYRDDIVAHKSKQWAVSRWVGVVASGTVRRGEEIVKGQQKNTKGIRWIRIT